MTYRKTGGTFQINESPQGLVMSISLGSLSDQFTATFRAGATSGSLQGVISGSLVDGTFRATVLVTVPAETAPTSGTSALAPRAIVPCEGTGEATGRFNGTNVSWDIGAITYSNCSLSTSTTATAVATTPVPPPLPAAEKPKANVVITILPGTSLRRSTCADGRPGYAFTVEIAEIGGVGVRLDDRIVVEERRPGQPLRTTSEENPFTRLEAGERKRWSACEDTQSTGTYQAFFSGTDDNGNRIRFASPLITLGDFVDSKVAVGSFTTDLVVTYHHRNGGSCATTNRISATATLTLTETSPAIRGTVRFRGTETRTTTCEFGDRGTDELDEFLEVTGTPESFGFSIGDTETGRNPAGENFTSTFSASLAAALRGSEVTSTLTLRERYESASETGEGTAVVPITFR
jgi:hypothetical protein